MYDIFLAGLNKNSLLNAYADLQTSLRSYGLVIAEEKVQLKETFSYLPYVLYSQLVQPQKIEIRKNYLHTLNDFQKLLGDVNWFRPTLKLTTGDLKLLFNSWKGSSDPTSLWQSHQARIKGEEAIQHRQLAFMDYDKSWQDFIFPSKFTPTAILWQEGPLYWIHLSSSHLKMWLPYDEAVIFLIQACWQESIRYFGKES